MQLSPATTVKQSKNQKKKVKKNIVVASKALAKDLMVYKVPECAEHYFNALCDPFNVPTGVCIPADLFPIPSQKCRTFVRGTFNLGTTGFGYIAFNPALANDVACTASTTSASIGNTGTTFSAYTATNAVNMTQLPYTAAQLAAGTVKGRIAAFGIRVKYIGKLMDSNGICVSFEDPDHRDVLTNYNYSTLNANPYTTVDRVYTGNHWDKAVCYSGPTTISDYEFSAVNQPLLTTFMIVAISGVAGDLYEFEIYQHTEYLGQIVVGKSFSHADPTSFGKVLETVKAATINKPLEPVFAPTLWERFKQKLSDSLPHLISGGKAVIESAMKLSPSKLYEGYLGIERGFNNLQLDYGPQVKSKVKLLPAPTSHFPSMRDYVTVQPTSIEIVDDVEVSPLIRKAVEERKKELAPHLSGVQSPSKSPVRESSSVTRISNVLTDEFISYLKGLPEKDISKLINLMNEDTGPTSMI
jgi:hypothetical protein